MASNKRKGRGLDNASLPLEDTTQPGVPGSMGNAAPALSGAEHEAEIDEAATTALSATGISE